MRLLLTIVALALLVAIPAGGNPTTGSPALFPRPAELEGDVRFWRRVYTEVGTDGGFLHDTRDLRVVYEVMRFAPTTSSRSREKEIEKARRKIKDSLLRLSRGKRSRLSQDDRRVLALFPEGVSDKTLRTAAGNIRFQLGQADKFRAGLIRSGAWRGHILETLREMGLPEELVALPHVESSYTPHAYSRVGAAGLWQFTRSTGRRYMRVDHVVDERMDPLVATIAAARLLAHNRQSTGTWPLALTAYNHGAAGMRRAARQVGTTDIEVIARKYKSRTFGFASRNFYVEFLAALEVDRNAERYFGKLPSDAPVDYDSIELPAWIPAKALAEGLDIDLATLRRHNPALRESVWNGSKRVPKGFAVRVPRSELAKPLGTLIAGIPKTHHHAAQTRDTYHKVQRGESLSVIAARYGVRIDELVAMNGLRSRHSIRAGQKLRLPLEGGSTGAAVAAIASKPAPPPLTKDGRYKVRRGDTVSRIASRHGISERELMGWNGIVNRNRIRVGQWLHLSAPAGAPAPEPTAEEPVQILADAAPPSSRSAFPAAGPEGDEASVDVTDAGPGLIPPAADAEIAGELQADPNDYSVADDGTIEIQAAETLGHYAEWLDLRASRLRSLNRMRYGTPVVVGERLRLDFDNVSREEFEARRTLHHQMLQQEFFAQYEIAGTTTHVVRAGDSIWRLAQRKYDVPLWLVRQYNPDLDFADLHAGTQLTFPALKPRIAN